MAAGLTTSIAFLRVSALLTEKTIRKTHCFGCDVISYWKFFKLLLTSMNLGWVPGFV